jgi:NTE family protein
MDAKTLSKQTSRSKLLILIAALTLACQYATAQFAPEEFIPAARPRVGLVLGGGGAKGAAHIGVLRALEELRIPIDCVAGTSMGALVGATFAGGMSAADIETAVVGIDWSRTLGGQGRRDRTPIHRKLTQLTYSNPLELGIGGDGIRSPGGLLQTQDVEDVIRRLVANARFTQNFDDLPIPFRAVATDMLTGEMVVLGAGDISVAMRASMAIPGVFAPVTIDGKVLADGGMMRNLPVDVARDLCADVVIAVWLATPPPEAEDVSSAFALIGRSMDVMIRANERTQIATLTQADVGIGVQMGDIATDDFLRVADAIELGYAATFDARDALSRYALPEDEYRAWNESVRRANLETHTLAEVRITGLDRVNPEYVETRLDGVMPGATVTAEDLGAAAERIFSVGDFERVDYELLGPPEARVLEYRPTEKSWGPDFLRLDIGLAAQGDGDIRALARADHDRTWLNDRGAQWHNRLQFGRESVLASDFYQPFDARQRFFVQPIIRGENSLEDLYIDGDRVAQYDFRQLYGQIDVGMNIGNRAQLRAGVRDGWFEADLDTGPPDLPEIDRTDDTTLQLRAVYDTRDSVGYPTRGTFMNVRYASAKDWFDGTQNYRLLEGVIEHAFDFRGNSLRVIGGGGNKLEGDVPVNQTIELGGIRTFPGLFPGELRGSEYWFVGTTYAWRVLEVQPLFGQALYAGLRLQAGEVRDRFDEIDEGTLYGISGAIGGRTPIGPFLLSLGYVDNGSMRLQLSIGLPVAEGSILDEVH